MTNAISAFGTQFQVGDGATPEQFTTVAEITALKPANVKGDPIDVTSHDSTGGFKEYIIGLLEAGEADMTLNFVPSEGTHDFDTGLLSFILDRTPKNFQVIFPDSGNTTWAFRGNVIDFAINADPAKQLIADVKIRLTGEPTFA